MVVHRKRELGIPADSPLDRWERTAELLKLCVVSTRVANVAAPLNLLIVGPPGDGKTEMIRRVAHLPFVHELSDASYLGITRHLEMVRDGYYSALLVPDFATIVGRKYEVARQTVSALAMMAAEGVGEIAVGKTEKDFRGAKSSVITAITDREFASHHSIINQNAFLSRCFVCNFDLELPEVERMMQLHDQDDHRHIAPLRFGEVAVDRFPKRQVQLSVRYKGYASEWWKELKAVRPDMWFSFRTAHHMRTLLLSSAYLHGRRSVTRADVRAVERVLPLLHNQMKLSVTAQQNGGQP